MLGPEDLGEAHACGSDSALRLGGMGEVTRLEEAELERLFSSG